MSRLRTPTVARCTLLALCQYTLLATPGLAAGAPSPAGSQVRLQVIGADGTLSEYAAVVGDFAPAPLGALPFFTVDGEQTTDPIAVLDGRRIEIALATGELLVLERQGRTLTRLAGREGEEGLARSVSWNDRMDVIRIETAAGVGVVSLEGLENPLLRARYFADLAVRALGAHPGAGGEAGGVPQKLGPAIIIPLAVLGIVGYLACVLGGTSVCSNAAEDACTYGVHQLAVVCGFGYDVEGKLQLGYNCSFICNDPPPPPPPPSGGGGGCVTIGADGTMKQVFC